MPSLAELEDVVKVYGPHPALGPVTMSIPDGSVGLLGPNGSGKTTLIRLMMGLLRPTGGTVRVLGVDPAEDPSFHQRIGYVPEGDSLFPGLTGVEAVTYAGRLVGMHKADAIERAHQVLDYVQLADERYRLSQNYSTGMRQRLKLAQAIVHDPDLLVLDEPTEGVDPRAREHILELIDDLTNNHGIHLLLSTHQLPDVERLADHAIVLQEGLPVAEGTIEELKRTEKKSHLVRVNGPLDALVAHLETQDVEFTVVDPDVRIELEDPRRVLQLVQESGSVVRHLVPTELSLTEAYQTATGGEQDG